MKIDLQKLIHNENILSTEIYNIPVYILASKQLRFFNFIIDLIFLRIFTFVFFIVIDLIFNITITNQIDNFNGMEIYLFWSILSFIYYCITEFLFSKSISKIFTKTCVVTKNGEKPNFSKILVRSALRQIPFEYFTFFQGRKLGLHDEYSNTFVVKTDKLKQSLKEFSEFK